MSGSPLEQKLFFTIGEVARLTSVKPHVLRFWEQEFPSLSPRKDVAGRRIYRRRDIETVHRIRRLLHEEKFTIAGARKALLGEELDPPSDETVTSIRRELGEILTLLREG